MEIRLCREEDIAAAGAFYDSVVLYLESHINYPRWVYGVYPCLETVKERVPAQTQYICVENGQIIGAFVLNADPEGNYQKGNWSRYIPDGAYLVLHALATAPDMRRRGIGAEIIRFSVEKAKREGYKAIRLDTVPDNYPAKKMYEKNGFTYIGDYDLERVFDRDEILIPFFSLFEMNLPDEPVQ